MILAHLYECIGCLDSAEYQYRTTLNERPDYAFAYAGLGRIAKANGEYKDAITYLEKAKSTITEYTFADELTDLYRLNNELNKSIKSSKEVITMLNPMVEEDETSSAHGHYADKELAYAYLKINDTANAFKHGLLEYKRRPNNIDICEAMAWIYYKKANYNEANKMINHALRTNSQNPTLLYRAGLIKINAGENEMGIQLIKRASNNQKKTSEVDLKIEATKYLKTI